MSELRLALRALSRSPGFTTIALITLALGIGANTAVFSVVNALLLRPLPYANAERLVALHGTWEGQPAGNFSPPELVDARRELRSFDDVGAYLTGALNLNSADGTERVAAAFLDAGVLPALGVTPVLGSVFTPEQDLPDAATVVMLSHELWVRNFGSDPDVVGRAITVDNAVARIVGVLPPGFRMPNEFEAAEPAQLFTTMNLQPPNPAVRGSHYLNVIGRIRSGVSIEAANADVRAMAARFIQAYPDEYPPHMRYGAFGVPLRDEVIGPVRQPLLLVLGAVGLVLLIACANVANLLLTRADARRREFAVRAALGAGRVRLARQLLVESLVLAGIGGTLGVLVAVWGVDLLVELRPPGIPRLAEIAIDTPVLLVAVGSSLFCGMLFGLAPMRGVLRPQLYGALRDGGRTIGDHASNNLRRNLVVAETALALVLLAGAALLTRSFIALRSVDPGYRTENVLTLRITPPVQSYLEVERVITLYDEIFARVRAVPGVAAVGGVSNLPLNNPLGDLNFEIEGQPVAEGQPSPRSDWQVITPGYFDAIGMQLVRGRGIDPTDGANAPGAVVINEALAARFFQGRDPIGLRVTLGTTGPGAATIVGIARDIRHASLSTPANPEMYLAHAQFRFWNGGTIVRPLALAIRSQGDPAALAEPIRAAVRAIDPQLPIGAVRTMDEVRAGSVAQPRFLMSLLLLFAAVALALAAIGTYGVLAYTVARRTNEMGVRMALGAQRRTVAGMVVQDGMKVALIGIAIGCVASLALTRLLGSLLYGISATDPLTLAGVATTLALVALGACLIPALRATRVDPIVSLRRE